MEQQSSRSLIDALEIGIKLGVVVEQQIPSRSRIPAFDI